MSSNHTQNYNLSQWEPGDAVLRTDFNSDNAKIDAALKAEATARAAADAALNSAVARCGNCKIYTLAYTGTGTYGRDNPKTFTFPKKPLFVFIFNLRYSNYLPLTYGVARAMAGGEMHENFCETSWSGNSVSLTSLSSGTAQMNQEDAPYLLVAFMAADT